MNNTATSIPGCELHRGQTISMDGDRRGLTLRCLSGEVWVTQPGDLSDYLIPAGHEFKVTRPGRVVIEAVTPVAELAA
jgi:hypothetical protein